MKSLNPLKTPQIPYDFAVGRSNPETFPIEKVQEAATRAIGNEYEEITEYPGKLGHLGLRKVMARRESDREGVPVDPDLVTLLNGSMQAVTLTAEALTSPGDSIICEELTYVGTISAYRSLGIEMHGVPLDDDGMRTDLLESKIEELGESNHPKFIYALTTYQNPTGSVMSHSRRLELLEIAERYDIPVVDDNCYGDVHYDGDKPKSLYALTDYDKVIYMCSLSKILAPGLRLGYLYAQENMLEKILARRHDAGGNYLAAAIVAELYRENVWDLTEELNHALKVKKNLVISGLANELEEFCAWSNPPGGMFVWVRFPEDVDQEKLTRLCTERGFAYAPGANFHIEGKTVPYLRLAFGHVPDKAIQEGIPVLASCIRESRTSNETRSFAGLYD